MKDASDQVIVYLPRALGMCVSGSAAHERGKLQSMIDGARLKGDERTERLARVGVVLLVDPAVQEPRGQGAGIREVVRDLAGGGGRFSREAPVLVAGAVKEVEGKVQAEIVGERHARGSVEQHRPGRRARAHLAPPEQLDHQREAGEDAEPLHHEHDEALRPGGGRE